MSIIVIDVGGTKISSAIAEGTELIDINIEKTDKDVIEQIKKIISSRISGETKKINIAWAGWITLDGIISRSPHLLVNNLNLQSYLSQLFSIPVKIDNDANVFTLSEAQKRPGSSVTLGITIGTGLGAGVITKGEVFRGAHNFAAEVGHQQIGQRCAEEWFSGASNDIKDNVTKRIPLFAEWISNLALAYDPDIIVIGGTVGIKVWAPHLPAIRKIVDENLKHFPIYPQLICTEDEHSTLRGASLM